MISSEHIILDFAAQTYVFSSEHEKIHLSRLDFVWSTSTKPWQGSAPKSKMILHTNFVLIKWKDEYKSNELNS